MWLRRWLRRWDEMRWGEVKWAEWVSEVKGSEVRGSEVSKWVSDWVIEWVSEVRWSYCANRFELDFQNKIWPCLLIEGKLIAHSGCLLIDLVMLIDIYRSLIVRFGSPTTRSFLSPFLSFSCLSSLRGERKNLWDRNRVQKQVIRLSYFRMQ